MKTWFVNNPFALLLIPLIAWILIANPEHLPYESAPNRGSALQQTLVARYQTLGIQGRELATICALTLGDKSALSKETKHQFSAAGAMHVLAVSGLHTGILMSVLLGISSLFGLCKPLYEEHARRWITGTLIILVLIAFAWLTGGSPSVTRAVVMASLVILAKMCHRENQMLNALFASAFLILVFRPLDLFSISFQLSFSAVLAIALFAPGWQHIMPRNYFISLLGMTLAATIGTLPVTLYYFGQISNYFILTNLIVVPLAWFMMIGGVLVLSIGWITPIGIALAWCLNGFTWAMNESVAWLESLPHSTTMVHLPLWGMWALMAVNLGIIILWNKICLYPYSTDRS